MSRSNVKHGDFTGLAENYSKYRPGYSTTVRDALLGLLGRPATEMDVADVGAGTGIWTRLLKENARRVVAVEPNEEMRRQGIADCAGLDIEFFAGDAEQTSLETESVDMVTMASSFHWADFEKSLAEFHRILRPEGRFAALWNPRLIEVNPLQVEVEAEISRLNPNMKRVSSGSSGITETLFENLAAHPLFTDVIYLEARHEKVQSPADYIGVWNSVNDVRHQLGEENWEQFMDFVERRVSDETEIITTYRTRAWSARRA